MPISQATSRHAEALQRWGQIGVIQNLNKVT
jgi:hypothetical protein